MSRSHPPALATLVRRTVREHALFGRGDVVLVAVSGGPDSMATLDVLGRLRGELGHSLVAHGVDHGLRREAAEELDLAAQRALALGVPMTQSRVVVARGGNLQARAREARRTALLEAAGRAGAAVIATGHHADDRAETVLMRLLRGAGPRGLAALPPRAGSWVRPLVRARRAEIEAHLARHGVAFARDPSNADPRFLRSRIRAELLPLLAELSPGVVTHLVALADQLARSTGPAEEEDAADLPRATRDALRSLAVTKSIQARVMLPGGLVARYDRAQLSIVIERGPISLRQGHGRGAA